MKKKGKKKKKQTGSEEGSDADSEIEKKKKGKSRLRRHRAGSVAPSGSDSEASDGQGRRKKRKRKKKRSSRAPTATTEESSFWDENGSRSRKGSKFTTEEEKSTEKSKEITEADLVERMKRMIPFTEPDSPLWSKWNLSPLYNFIRNKNATLTIALVVKVPCPEDNNEAKGNKVEENSQLPDMLKRLLRIFSPDENGISLVTLNQIIPGFAGEMFYFVKQEQVKLNGFNFDDMVVFGNIPDGHLDGLKNVVSYFWTHLLMEDECLASGVKDEVFTDLSTLSCVSQNTAHFIINQELLLYIPPEVGGDRKVSELAMDKGFCSRLEETITFWLTKLKEALIVKELDDTEGWPGPLEEIQFWKKRSENFSNILVQMRSTSMKRLIKILVISHSPFITELHNISIEINQALKEATSNYCFLQNLSEPCSIMFKSKLREVPVQIQKFLWLVLTIWRNAPYYNTPKRINGLLRKFSNYLINRVRDRVKVEQLLQGLHIITTEKKTKNFLRLLAWWKEVYGMTEKTFLGQPDTKEKWIFDYDIIFCHVDSMIQRLNNILEICEIQKLFCRRKENSGNAEELPLYPGVRGPYISNVMKIVSETLVGKIDSIIQYHGLILNVKNVEWHEHMQGLQNVVTSIEITIQNLLEEVFDQMSNLRQRLDLLKLFHKFTSRDVIARQLDKLSIKLYEYFEREILFLRKLFERKIIPLPRTFSHLAGRGAWALYMKKRIENQLSILKSGEDHLPKTGFADYIKSEAKSLAESLSSFAYKTYEDWANSKQLMDSRDYKSKLDLPILIRKGRDKKDILEVNFDRDLYKNLTEAEIWHRVGRPVPPGILFSIFPMRESLHDLFENATLIARLYNDLITSLSIDERLLFQERLLPLEKKIYPCLTEFTWSSEVTADEIFTEEFHALAREVKRRLMLYRETNLKIAGICLKISKKVKVVAIDPKCIYDPSEYRTKQNEMIQSQIYGIVKEYKKIAELIQEVFKFFKSDGSEVKFQWGKYARLIDECFEEALCISLRNSLSTLESVVCRAEDKPVFKVEMNLENNTLAFHPDLKSLSEMILGTHANVAFALQPLSRISNYLGMGSVKGKFVKATSFADALLKDEISLEIQDTLQFSIERCFSELNLFSERWTPYRDVWELDKTTFMSNYEKMYPSIDAYEKDLEKYLEISKVVQGCENMINIRFLQVDCSKLKEQIGRESADWFEVIACNLYDKAKNALSEVYKFMENYVIKLTREPQNLDDQMELFKVLQESKLEGRKKLVLLPGFCEQFALLERFEFQLEPDLKDRLENLDCEWRKYQKYLKEVDRRLQKSYDELRNAFLDQAERFKEKVEETVKSFEQKGPFSGDAFGMGQDDTGEDYYQRALLYLENTSSDIKALKQEESELNETLKIFTIVKDKNQNLIELELEIACLTEVWNKVKQWDHIWKSWKSLKVQNINRKKLDEEAVKFLLTFNDLRKEYEKKLWPILSEMIEFIETVQVSLKAVDLLKNKTLRERHWNLIKDLLGLKFDQSPDSLDLDKVVELKLHLYLAEITEISLSSGKETAVEKTLERIKNFWEEEEFILKKRKGIVPFEVQFSVDLQDYLMDHIVSLSAMKGSVYIGPFREIMERWLDNLQRVNLVLEKLIVAQKEWIFMETIFANEEIETELPSQAKRFKICGSLWASIVLVITDYKIVVETVKTIEELPAMLTNLNEELNALKKDLNNFLSAKRQDFPRFYFLPDHDLLQLLQNSKNPVPSQGIVTKMFKGVHRLILNSEFNIRGITSAEDEVLELTRVIDTNLPLEFWFQDFESALKKSVKLHLKSALDDLMATKVEEEWLLMGNHPGQCCTTALRIQWTSDLTSAIHQNVPGDEGLEIEAFSDSGIQTLKKIKRKVKKRIDRFAAILTGKRDNSDNRERIQIESNLEKLKVMNVVVILAFMRDAADRLYSRKCDDLNSFEWLQYMRFYWEEGKCKIKQGFASITFGNEYLGNAVEIVMTPLTERCFLALTTAISFQFGAYLHGSVNAGKKTAIKTLANLLGIQVLDLSVSEETEHASLSSFITGIVQTGSWLILQNIESISPTLVTLVSNKLELISHAKREGFQKLMLDGLEVNLDENCGIFGIFRSKPKDYTSGAWSTLRGIMRPVAMIQPDAVHILQMKLFLFGFENSTVFAKQVYTIFSCAKDTLHCENRCNFALDGMIAVVKQASDFKRMFGKRINEAEAIIKALQNIVSSSLTSVENSVFAAIIKENFPDDIPLKAENVEIEEAVKCSFKALKYQVSDPLIRLCLRLYELIQIYKGVIIIGKTGSGKTTIRNVLRNALMVQVQEANNIKEYIINPNAYDSSELYGFTNKEKGQWHDGIVANILRNECQEEANIGGGDEDEEVEQVNNTWIVVDGVVNERDWTEHGIYELVDSGTLTLANGDVIVAPEQMSIFVETDDLSHASPGFISKTGVLFINEQPNQWKLQLKSWLNNIRDTVLKSELSSFLLKLLETCLRFRRENLQTQGEINRDESVTSALIRMIDALILQYPNELGKLAQENKEKCSFLTKQITSFCIVWSIFGAIELENIRIKVSTFLKDLESKLFPAKGTVFDYFIDVDKQRWTKWEDLSKSYNLDNPTSFYIHSPETARCYYFLSKLRTHSPILISGAGSTGKTSIIKTFLKSLEPRTNAFLHMKRTHLMKARSMQAVIQSRLEPISSIVLSPSRGKSLTVFIDDLNDLAWNVEKMDSCCEFLRQLVEHRMWHNRVSGNCLAISNLSIIAAVTTNQYHANEVPQRLQSKFNQIGLSGPDEFQMRKIFTAVLIRKMADFPPQVRSLADDITVASLELHKVMSSTILPSPHRPLHAFDISDISQVYDGLLRGNREAQDTKLCFIRLWFHESIRVYHDRLMDSESRRKCLDILSEQLLKHFELQKKKLFPLNGLSIFGNFMSKNKLYEEIKDEAAVRELLNSFHNSKPGRTIIFLEAIKQIAKIARVISVEGGHLINCGIECQGRTTLTNLVCHIYNYKVFFMDNFMFDQDDEKPPFLPLNSENYAKLFNMLKTMYRSCAVDKQGCCLVLKDEHINDLSLDLISLATSTVEIPELFTEEEFAQIKEKILKTVSLKIPKRKREVSLLDDCNASVWDYFVDEVRRNAHVVLCTNPTKSYFRKNILKYPGLVKNMRISWFDIWKKESYLEVAHTCLRAQKNVDILQNPSPLLETLYAFHSIAVETSEEARKDDILNAAYITPTHLMDLVETINSLQDEVGRRLKDRIKTLQNAMTDVTKVQARIGNLSDAASKAEQKVQVSRTECDELWAVIEIQQKDTNIQEELVNEKSGALEVEEKEYEELADVVKMEWTDALQEFEYATEILEDLGVEDLNHIRSYYSPPPLVSRVLDAVMIMLERDQNWPEAKIQLGNPDFIKNIVEFDKARVTMEKLHSLRKFVQNKEFTPEAVAKYSNGARILCAWILAIEKYGRTYLTCIIPKREKLEESRCSIEEKRAALEFSQQKLELLQENLKELKVIYEAKHQLKVSREEDMENCAEILNRATSVLELIQDDLIEWKDELGLLETKLGNLLGDSMIAAAYLVYLGPFTKPYREKIKKEWSNHVSSQSTSGVKVNPDWKLEEFLGCTSKFFRLDEALFAENFLIFERGRSRSLIIDPYNQAQKVIPHLNTKRNEDNDARKTLALNAVQLVEFNLSQEISHHYYRWKHALEQGSQLRVSGSLQNSEGCELQLRKIILKTREMNPSLRSSVTGSNFSVINFSLNNSGLTDYIRKRIAKLVTNAGFHKCDSLHQILLAEKQHVELLRERIPSLIITCGDSILDNGEFPETLLKWKREITEALEKIHATQKEILDLNEKSKQFCAVAETFSELFTIITEISHCHPFQEVSLEHFLKLIEITLQEFFQMKSSDSPSSSPRRDTTDAVQFLGTTGYLYVLGYLRKGMFIQQKYQFALLLCIWRLWGKQKNSTVFIEELTLLVEIVESSCDNLSDLFSSNDQPPALILNQNQMELLEKLNKTSNCNGITDSITVNDSESWTVWASYLEPENKLPSAWEEKLTNFEKLLVVSILRPDRFFSQIEMLTSEIFGEQSCSCLLSPQLLDLKETYEDAKSINSLADSNGSIHPILFIHQHLDSSTNDPKASITALGKSIKPQQKLYSLQVTNENIELAIKLMNEGMRIGFWVYFPNCHLSLKWIWQMQELLMKNKDEHVHSGFCLWLSTKETSNFSRKLLRNSVKIAVESGHTLELGMLRLFMKMPTSNGVMEGTQDKFKRLLYGLSYLHCFLVGRQKYSQDELSGDENEGIFNDSDFEIASTILKIFTMSYGRVPWWALKQILELQYSNHFSSGWTHQQLIQTIVKRLFSDETITEPEFRLSSSGPVITMPPFEENLEEKTNMKSSRNSSGDLTTIHRHIQLNCPSSNKLNENPEIYGLSQSDGLKKKMSQVQSMFQSLRVILRRSMKFMQQQSCLPYLHAQDKNQLNWSQAKIHSQGQQEVQLCLDKALEMTKDLLEKLPNEVDESNVNIKLEEFRIGGKSEKLSRAYALLVEMHKFNENLRNMKSSLEKLRDALNGKARFDMEMEAVLDAVLTERLPENWNQDFGKRQSLIEMIQSLKQREEVLIAGMNSLGGM